MGNKLTAGLIIEKETKKPITDKQLAKLGEFTRLRREGFSYVDIGGAFHVSAQAVYQFIKRHQ